MTTKNEELARRIEEQAVRIAALEKSLRWAMGEMLPLRRRVPGELMFCGYCVSSRSHDKRKIKHEPDCEYARALGLSEGK